MAVDEERLARARRKLEEHALWIRQGNHWAAQGTKDLSIADDEERKDLAVAWFEVMADAWKSGRSHEAMPLTGMSAPLLARDLGLEEPRLRRMIAAAATARAPPYFLPTGTLMRELERAAARGPLSAALLDEVRRLRRFAGGTTKEARREIARLDALLGVPLARAAPDPGEVWSDRTRADLEALAEQERHAWDALLDHLSSAKSAQPARAWLERARKAVEAIGVERFESAISAWFPLVQKPAQIATVQGPYGGQQFVPPIGDRNGDLLRGLVWSCATLSSPALASLVGNLAVVCFAKIPNYGPVSAKVGNACVYTLGACPGLAGVAQLGRLKTQVKYAVANRLIERAFDAAAKRTGFGRVELADLAVPTFGLTSAGAGEVQIGDATALIAIGEDDAVSVRWRSAAGKEQASPPAEVSRDHAPRVKELRRRVKDIRMMLTAQRHRLEGMLGGRSLALADFRSRVLDHPLLAPIARRLIVEIRSEDRTTLAVWSDGALVDVVGRPVPKLADDATVELWHPIGSDVATVKAWRDALHERGVTQPFKQAHREIYVLTDAERQTETYSNRFAAHVLRQHVLAALCRERGWAYSLQGGFDGQNAPRKSIEGTDLGVEFSVNAPEHGEAATSNAGIYLHVQSDHVRFHRAGWQPVPLTEIPPLIFSEAMRDIDLFVALASVGNDPTWVDRGDARLQAYWQGFAFGELSATARTRREVLEGLLPRLRIADRCTLADRFLVVRGDLRTYKIHLGSANILMEPNDQYLCIVPGRSGSKVAGVRLPFEGDATLSVILSKAILLAADKTIVDPSIVSQIARST